MVKAASNGSYKSWKTGQVRFPDLDIEKIGNSTSSS